MKFFIDSRKTAFFSVMALVISFFVFFIIMSFIPDTIFLMHKEFYEKSFPTEKKIFILGSSHVYSLNSTFMTEYLSENGFNYIVYNLGQGSDDPEFRLRTIDFIISKKPDIVVYGIGFRDFESTGRTVIDKPNNYLPRINSILELFSEINLPINKGLIENPKFAIVRALLIDAPKNDQTELEKIDKIYENAPFFPYYERSTIIAEPSTLEKLLIDDKLGAINPPTKNLNLVALQQIIDKLKENNIKIIIFTTPHSKIWLEHQPVEQKQNFENIIQTLGNSVKVYRFHDKYEDMWIWEDNSHIVVSKKTLFYSKDISDIILKEIGT